MSSFDTVGQRTAANKSSVHSALPLPLAFHALAVLVAVALVGPARGQSLWQYRHPSKAFMFYDSQARDVGDTVTIVIQEDTDVDNVDEQALDRSDSSSGNFEFSGASSGQLGSLAATADIGNSLGSEGSQSGRARTSVDRQFRDRISAVIVDKLPNGNLVVQGVRHRVISGERRTLRVSGIIRPIDIRPDNTIDSTFVANFTMCYAGDGQHFRHAQPGWLRRTLDHLRLNQGRGTTWQHGIP